MTYVPADDRYEHLRYRRFGRSGLQLPAVSLGLWQNFGYEPPLDTSRAIVRRAFDLGSRTSTSRTTTGRPTDPRRRTSASSCSRICAHFATS